MAPPLPGVVEAAELARRLKQLEEQNEWSHSYTRRMLIATLTYLMVCLYLYETQSPDPFVEGILHICNDA